MELAVPAPHERLVAMGRLCGSGRVPLGAAGNEALQCKARGSLRSEYVVGRVRDQVFLIKLSTNHNNDPILTDEMLRMHVTVAAEQVSGNLF